jgi:hypothetical protein
LSGSPCCDFQVEALLQHPALVRGQVVRLVLVVDGEQPELIGVFPEVDDPQSAPLALAAPLVGVADFSQSASTLDYVAGRCFINMFCRARNESSSKYTVRKRWKGGSSTNVAFIKCT